MNRLSLFGFLFPLFLLFVIGGLAGCEAKLKTFELDLGGTVFTVEIADTSESRTQGLMNRKSLPENAGMLFVFERDDHYSFWMKNTVIPLSLAFISRSGEIKEIHDLTPGSLRPVQSEYAVRFALEVNRGVFEKHGIKPGHVIGIPGELLR